MIECVLRDNTCSNTLLLIIYLKSEVKEKDHTTLVWIRLIFLFVSQRWRRLVNDLSAFQHSSVRRLQKKAFSHATYKE